MQWFNLIGEIFEAYIQLSNSRSYPAFKLKKSANYYNITNRYLIFDLSFASNARCSYSTLRVHSDCNSAVKLPAEYYGLDLQSVCSDFKEHNHCELYDLCIVLEYSSTRTSTELVRVAMRKGEELGCKYMFQVVSLEQAVFFKKIAQSLFYYLKITDKKIQLENNDQSIELSLIFTDYYRNKDILACKTRSQ